MIRRGLQVLALLMAPLAASAAQGFVQFGSPAYDALKTAVLRINVSGWEAQRIKRDMPVTDLVARELAKSLIANKSLEPQYKKALEAAFPSETKPVDERYEGIKVLMNDIGKEISKVTSRLDRFEAGMRDGLLSSRGRPSLLGSLDASIYSTERWLGLGHTGYLTNNPHYAGSGLWTEWTMAGDGYNLTWVMEFYQGYIDFTSAHLGLFFDNSILPGIEVVVADENTYPAMSNLVFNGGGGGYNDDFGDITSLSGRKELVKSGPGYGARGGQDIYIRRKNSGDWWPFSDTQFVASQTYNYYYGQLLNDVAFNVKIRGLPLFWPFERSDPSFTNVWSFNDTADLVGQGNTAYPPTNSSAQALILNTLISGGGNLYMEVATAEWESNWEPTPYRDEAVQAIFSKSFLNSAATIDYQYTGPNYYAGTRGEPSGNFAQAWDPQFTTPGKVVYLTQSGEPTEPSGNSQHMALGLTSDFGSGAIGITLGSNQDIVASGPRVETRHMIGWPWTNQPGDKKSGHGFSNYIGLRASDYAAYNDHPGQAYYKGAPYDPSWPWVWLDDKNRENIMLTQKGVGDPNFREDSVKFVNFIDLRGDINFQSLFGMERPFLLKLASRIRNTNESMGLATYDDKALLLQMASSLTLNVELPGRQQFVWALGYEDIVSNMTFLPMEYHTTWTFFQYWKDFPQFLSGFSIGPRIAWMSNSDPHDGIHDFSALSFGVSSGTTF